MGSYDIASNRCGLMCADFEPGATVVLGPSVLFTGLRKAECSARRSVIWNAWL